MNPTNFSLRASIAACCLLILPFAANVSAATTDIANAPLGQAGVNPVRPNIHFILDDSGSMDRAYVPDSMGGNSARHCFKNHVSNQLFYNPAITYLPPKNFDGTNFANASFTAALRNGFNSGDGSTNLSTKFDAGDGVAQAAYYYRYTGTSPAIPVPGTCYVDTSYTKVVIGAAEQTNFANWFSYYRTRMLTMKSSVGRAFVNLNDKYRVGFSAINDSVSVLDIKNFDAAHKKTWFESLYKGDPSGFTPLRRALSRAGRNYAGKEGTDPVQYSCQQNFALLSTDGFWNDAAGYRIDGSAIGDHDDDVPRPFFQGRALRTTTQTDTTTRTYARGRFGCKANETRIQMTSQTVRRIVTLENGVAITDTTNTVSGPTTTNVTPCSTTPAPIPATSVTTTTSTSTDQTPEAYKNSLSDVAMYYYKTDLRDSSLSNCTGAVDGANPAQNVCPNNVPTSANLSSITDDNATHQHMTTFTLGLGVDGELKYAENYKTGGSSDYNAILQGTKNWPVPDPDTLRAVDDLWHAAVNGRGTYFSAKNPDNIAVSLTAFFKSIASKVGAGAAAATSNLEPVAGDNYAFVANYRTVKWDGDLQARLIDLDSGLIQDTSAWSARDQLNTQTSAASDSRTIYKFKGSGPSGLETFVPGNFTAAQKTAWFNTTNLSQYTTLDAAQKLLATSDNLINYLRGQRGFENGTSNLATNRLFREREFVLGDIINGRPIYMKKPPFAYSDAGYASFKSSTAVSNRPGTVYIAANDGMLHAFDADTGAERWAYMPSAVLPNLYKLADTNYGDAGNHQYFVDGSPVIGDIYDGTKWKTILVGGLNAGGRMYYALDVTDPTSPKALWEFTNTNLGLTYGNPVITKQADGKWVVLVTSGYNNVSPGDGVGRLFVLDAEKGTIIREISTGAGNTTTPSGLGKIAAYVDNGLTDNSTLRVYGGDLLGNLWRFDITDTVPPAGIEVTLLATLKDGGGNAQPITARPELGQTAGRNLVFVGTGRLLGTSDLIDTSQQSLYAVYDKLQSTGVGNPRTSACPFVQQTITGASGSSRTISQNPVDLTTKCGWYLDFNPGGASPGERMNVDMILQLGVLSVVTNVPEASACTSGGTSWLYLLDYATGGELSSTSSTLKGGTKLGNSLAVGQVVYRLPGGKTVSTVTTSDDKQITVGQPEGSGAGAGGKRVYWRELFDK